MPVRAWLGGILVVVGGLWLLDAAEVVDAGAVVADWWPLALVGLALTAVVAERRVSTGTAVLGLIGLLLLVDRVVPAGTAAFVWPALAVTAGVALLLGLRRRGRPVDDEDQRTVAVLGGSDTRNRSAHFRHADVSAVMGGATLDLREAHVDGRARVDAFALMGGVDVVVPRGWRVELSGTPVLGGVEDKTDGPAGDDAPVLEVAATAVLGGVDVRHAPA